MRNENVMKTPQLLMKSKTRADNEIKIEVTDDEGQPSVLVSNFSHKDEFGWGFPEVAQAKKKNVVNMHWLNEYNDEIDKLQIVIKKERSLSFNSESGNVLGKRSSLKNDESELEQSLSSTHSFEASLPDQNASEPPMKPGLLKPTNLFVQVNHDELRSSTPIADVFCSIRSCPSRDSGISASDDISDTLPDVPMDRSLLAELEGVAEREQLEAEGDQAALNKTGVLEHKVPSSETQNDSKNHSESSAESSLCKCPVWYKKFSIGQNDLILNFSTLNWGLELDSEDEEINKFAFGKDDQYDSLLSRSDKGSSISDDSAGEVETVNQRRRQSLKGLWTICDKLEASTLRNGKSLKGMTELMELVKSLSKLDSRLEILKCDLQSLTRQATENKRDFNSLDERASNLLSSSERSRHHMSQLFCLERLEERLQEEWWAIHYPDLVTLEKNYVV